MDNYLTNISFRTCIELNGKLNKNEYKVLAQLISNEINILVENICKTYNYSFEKIYTGINDFDKIKFVDTYTDNNGNKNIEFGVLNNE
ncbi:MAG: hypothetical protein ACM3O3_12575 [Syntrophothermus sp.]